MPKASIILSLPHGDALRIVRCIDTRIEHEQIALKRSKHNASEMPRIEEVADLKVLRNRLMRQWGAQVDPDQCMELPNILPPHEIK